MKHILFVLDYFTPHRGGVETVFENIIGRLLHKGYKISVLTSHYDPKLPEIEVHEKLHIYRTGKGRLSFLFWAIKKGIGILRKHKDIAAIHGSTYGGAITASILGILFKKKVILTVHEVFGKLRNAYKGKWKGRLYRMFEKSIFWFPYDIYHCVSRYTMNSLRICYGIPDNKLKMIYNGVDYEFWDPEKVSKGQVSSLRKEHGRENTFIVLYYGHAGKSKGIDYLIEAVPGILALDEKIVVVFNLIESKRTKEIKERIEQISDLPNPPSRRASNPSSASLPLPLSRETNSIDGRVQVFDGFEKEELRRLVASVDCVVAPSISEGFGSVHSEVCAMGKPLITTDVASIPEVVSGDVIFVQVGSAEAIVEAVKKCWQTSCILDPLNPHPKGTSTPLPDKSWYPPCQGEQERKFSWEKTVEEIEKLY